MPYYCCQLPHQSSSSQLTVVKSEADNFRPTGNAAVEPFSPSERLSHKDEHTSIHYFRGERQRHSAGRRRSELRAGGQTDRKIRATPGWKQRDSGGRGEELRRNIRNVRTSPDVLMYGSDIEKRDYLEAVLYGDVYMSVDDCNELLSNLVRQKRCRDALALVHVWEQKPFSDLLISLKAVKTFTIMIDVYGKSRQLSRSFSIFHSMCRAGVEPNVITYNALIAACARSNEPSLAYEVFEDMQKQGLRADKFSYGSLIDSYAKSGQVDRAFQISQIMDKNGIQKDQTIYSALMDACGRAKQLDRAFSVFEEMKRNGVWPNLITFSVLIDTCANAREPERAFQLFSEIKHWGFPKANVIVYTALIDACSKAGWPERAELVMKSMVDNDVEPNEISFGALMDGWIRQGQLDNAFEVLVRMARDHDLRPNAFLIGALIDFCRKMGEFSRVKMIWGVVVKYNIRPSRTCYPGLICMAAKCGDVDIAAAIALHGFARGLLRRVSLKSENTTLYALACSLIYLKYVIKNDHSVSETVREQHLDRLRVAYNSTAMAQSDMISPEDACEHCMQWNNFVSRGSSHPGQRWYSRGRNSRRKPRFQSPSNHERDRR